MGIGKVTLTATVLVLISPSVFAQPAPSSCLLPGILREQQTISVRDPHQLAPAPIPETPVPPTVSNWPAGLPPRPLSLDDAIQTALANSRVVRVLTGVGAAASGHTVYDTAIANTRVDYEQARFDPQIEVQNSFNRTETPFAGADPNDPLRATLQGLRTDGYGLGVGVSKPTVTGGNLKLGVAANPLRTHPAQSLLNPQSTSAVELSYTQPLLQGGGMRSNLVPIVVARIETERSYFQFKDSMQNLVRGVIDAYWALVLARTDVWVREQQVRQLEQAHARAQAQFAVQRVSRAVVAQARVALSNVQASLIGARGDMLQREAALRNILGLPPSDQAEIIPMTPPRQERMDVRWEPLLTLAGDQRPDIIELKLILEADEQRLLQAHNQALPRLDAVGLYRWNGLEGEMPVGEDLRSRPGQFTDWTLAVNFSVPLGLRRERANVRQQELLLARDRVNLEQGMHQAAHLLAANVRNLAQYYEQYAAYREMRTEALYNLEQQWSEYEQRRVIFLNVLQALSDWGNAVNAEARSLLQYNAELASLEQQTGTILEAHGIRMLEERYGSIGPLGRCAAPRCYPAALPPTPSVQRYPRGEEAAEKSFDLTTPLDRRASRRDPLP
jgi:outer membrane protein TolC